MSQDEALRQHWENPAGGRYGLTLILGASPLPNLLAVLALRPSWIAILCSAKTEPGVDLLRAAIDNCIAESGLRPPSKRFGPAPFLRLRDAYRPAQIRGSFTTSDARELAQAGLFYTGGTKPMVTHIHETWSEHKGRPELACYLADEEEKFVFDDGFEAEIPDDVVVSLETLALLHGLTDLKADKVSSAWQGVGKVGGPTEEHLKLLLAATCQDPSICKQLYEAASTPEVYVQGLPSLGGMSRKAFEAWNKFIRGEWLDLAAGCFLFQAASKLGKEQRCSTFWNIRANLPAREFQLDACLVSGARLYAMSCTTDLGNRGLTKLKMFEVLERARQIGGDLARSAVVSLHDDTVRDDLQRDFPAPWEGDQRKPRIFGLSDVRAWQAGDLTTLSDWLRL